jgi:hypothetical protein
LQPEAWVLEASDFLKMSAEPDEENVVASRKSQVVRLRRMGLIILLAGLAIGAMIYFFGPAGAPTDENTLMSQYYKKEELDAQRLWGNGGSLVLGLTRSLKRASTYSVMVIVVSLIFAVACFYFASHPHQSAGENPRERK